MEREELESRIEEVSFEIEKLLQKQRRQEYNLFVSHSWSHNDEYEKMVDLLEDFPYFKFKNYSVPSTDPLDADSFLELVLELFEQIQSASVVIILGGMYAKHSLWIEIEMRLAEDLGKPMLGVKPWGNDRVPCEVRDSVNEMVGWQAHSVVGSVREMAE